MEVVEVPMETEENYLDLEPRQFLEKEIELAPLNPLVALLVPLDPLVALLDPLDPLKLLVPAHPHPHHQLEEVLGGVPAHPHPHHNLEEVLGGVPAADLQVPLPHVDAPLSALQVRLDALVVLVILILLVIILQIRKD